MSTETITLDIETMPTQNPVHIASIRRKLQLDLDSKIDALAQEAANIQPPGNIKDPEKIAEAMDKKRAAIAAQVEAAKVEASAALEKAYRDTSLNGGHGQVAVCSLATGSRDPFALYERNWKEAGAEKRVLLMINEALDDHCRHHRGQLLIGHNVINFDRQFLRQRGIVNGIRMHRLISSEVKPWDKDVVFDTMTTWTGDPRKFITMNALCEVLGIAGKGDDIDGSKVWDFIAAGRIDEVADYCNDDVRRTYAMYRRLMLLEPVTFPQPETEAVAV